MTGLASGSQIRQHIALAKLKWGHWEADFGCNYYPVPSLFLDFECLRMNGGMRNGVQGNDFAGGRGRKDRRDDVEPKTRTAPANDRNNWMQKVAIGDAAGTEDTSFRHIRGVTLWAKRVVDDEGVKLSTTEREGSAGLRRKE